MTHLSYSNVKGLTAAGALVALALVAAGPSHAAVVCAHADDAYAQGPPAGSQWNLAEVRAPEAWARGARGRGAVVAVIDSGVDLSHPDLRDRLVDGDDPLEHLRGDGQCPGPQDEFGHGTHVAGIVAANGGALGIAPRARILPIRVASAAAVDLSALAQGIRLAVARHVDVINLSMSVDAAQGAAAGVSGAIADAIAHDVVVVANAGNSSLPLCNYPASEPGVICVGATGRGALPSYYSNLPRKDNGLTLRAPGGQGDPTTLPDPARRCENDSYVWSTMWPASRLDCGPAAPGYDTVSGTSMATPHVSGVAALLAGAGLSGPAIIDCLRVTSSGAGTSNPVMGYGMPDAGAAVTRCVGSKKPKPGRDRGRSGLASMWALG
jgi:subtilisin family serine protease